MIKRYVLLVLISFLIAVTAQAQAVYNLDAHSQQTAGYLKSSTSVPFEFMTEAKAGRLFTLNPVLQHAGGVKVGDIVNLQLFENDIYTATVSDIVTDVNGTLALTLQLPDYPMAFAIITTSTEGKSLVTVSIPELGRSFGSRYHANVNYLLETDENKVERLHNENDAIPIPEAIEITEKGPLLKSVQASCGPEAYSNVNAPATISVLVVYTPAAANSSYASSHSGINNVISTMIALGNTCMSHSQTGITLTLAHSAQVSYTETLDMSTSLSRLQNPSDGYMDNVHALRRQYNADLVQLISIDNNSGGLGYLSPDTEGSYEYGFSVVYVTQVADSYPCSVHELGHNMGLGHGAQQTSVTATGIFSYSQGWTWTGNQTNQYGNKRYASVMSYSGNYYADGLIPAYTSYFSNPNVSYLGGVTGNATRADAARSLREMKHVIAYYSDRGANLPAIPTNIVVSNPTNSGATFSWNVSAGATSYRVGFEGLGFWTTTNTTYTVNYSSFFSACTSYKFYIAAVNECGDAVSSSTLTFKTKCATDPTVTTLAATNVTNISATLNKTVTQNGTAVTAQGFKYKATSSSSWLTNTTGSLTGLTANTQYQFYAYATTVSTTFTGNTLTFTTRGTPPVVVTNPATAITRTTATLNKTVTAGTETITAQGFEYKVSTASSWSTSATGTLSGLTPNTKYSFRAYATTAIGTVYGAELTFYTSGTRTWNGATNEWNVAANWTPAQVPTGEDDVVIPNGTPYYPIIKLADNAVCKTITLEAGAELGRQDWLTYNKARIQLNTNGLTRNQWHLLSMPVSQVYTGDFNFGGYPYTFLRKFTVTPGDNAGWEPFRNNNEPLAIGEGFALWVNSNDGLTKGNKDAGEGSDALIGGGTRPYGLGRVNGIIDFPYFEDPVIGQAHRVHKYEGGKSYFYPFATENELLPLYNQPVSVTRGADAYRLAAIAGGNVKIPLVFGEDNGKYYALAGNPYMTTIDFDKLYADNSTKIKPVFRIWTETGFVVYDKNNYIAPMQSFFVEKADNYSGDDKLIFNIATITATGHPSQLK
jgi:hypothetical protein